MVHMYSDWKKIDIIELSLWTVIFKCSLKYEYDNIGITCRIEMVALHVTASLELQRRQSDGPRYCYNYKPGDMR